MRERWASACAVFGRRAHSSNRSRSSAAKLKGAIGLPVRIRVPPPIRRTLADHNLFNAFRTQDTSVPSLKYVYKIAREIRGFDRRFGPDEGFGIAVTEVEIM